MDGDRFTNYRPRNAAIIGINYNVDWVRRLVKEWRDLALVKECICPDGSDRSNHRQDQAVLTILFYKYLEMYKFRNICCYVDLSIHNELLNN